MHVLLFFMSHELIYFYGHNDLEKTIKLYKEIIISVCVGHLHGHWKSGYRSVRAGTRALFEHGEITALEDSKAAPEKVV